MLPCLCVSLAPVNPFFFGKEWGQDELSQSCPAAKSNPLYIWGGGWPCVPHPLAVSHSRWKGCVTFPHGTVSCSHFAEWPFNLRSLSPFSVAETSLPLAFLRGDNAISVASVLNEGYFCFPPRLNLRTGSASFC